MIDRVVERIKSVQRNRDEGWEIKQSDIDLIFVDVVHIAKIGAQEGVNYPFNWMNRHFPIRSASWQFIWNTKQLAEALCFEVSEYSVDVRERIEQEYKDASCIMRMIHTFSPTAKDYAQFEQSDEFHALLHNLNNHFNDMHVDIEL